MNKKIVSIIGFPTEKAMMEWLEDQNNMDELKRKYPNAKAEVDRIERQIVVKTVQEKDNRSNQ